MLVDGHYASCTLSVLMYTLDAANNGHGSKCKGRILFTYWSILFIQSVSPMPLSIWTIVNKQPCGINEHHESVTLEELLPRRKRIKLEQLGMSTR